MCFKMCKNNSVIFYILIFFVIWWGAYIVFFLLKTNNRPQSDNNSSTLQMVHVLMRHGERYPDKSSLLPGSTYYDEKYYPEGYGQLTSEGRKREYDIGTYLRYRYDEFLGKEWHINLLEARSTDYNRTKMSLQLTLAGLYPPTGSRAWSSVYGQPIPYNYPPRSQDKELLPYYYCPRYLQLAEKLVEEPGIKHYLQRYDGVIRILANRTIKKVDVSEAFSLYMGFKIQEELGYPLEEWTKPIYPEPLRSIVTDMYYLMTNTTEIRRIVSGYLLKKILADTKAKINGTIFPPDRKMFIYSGHEMNVAPVLITLGTHERFNEIPPYGAYILFEVHNIDGVSGIKIFYQNYKQTDPVPLKIQGCDYFCPYDDFYRLLEDFLPSDDEECFGTLSSGT